MFLWLFALARGTRDHQQAAKFAINGRKTPLD
jgi:hypothetical protein